MMPFPTPATLIIAAVVATGAAGQSSPFATAHVFDPYSGFVVHNDPGGSISREYDTGPSFGERGYNALSIGGGAAFNSEANDYQLTVNYHHFLATDFEFNLSGSAWLHDQEDSTPFSGNFAIGFRYYFINNDLPREDQWAPYAEAGIGILGSTDEVPEGGTLFNFTPRAGAGVAIPVSDGGNRLDIGVRWHHISNASQFGTDDNPDRDSVMVYANLMFPL